MQFIKRLVGCGCLAFVFVFILGTVLIALEQGCSIGLVASAGIAVILITNVWAGLRGRAGSGLLYK